MRVVIFLVLAGALGCAGSQAQSETPSTQPSSISSQEPARVEVPSSRDFETTLAALTKAIESRGFKTFAIIDHAAGAQSVGLELAAATEIIFGNPKGGTPLMQADLRLGLELPLRILAYQGETGVMIRYPDMPTIVKSLGVVGHDPLLEKIAGALTAIAAEAAGPSSQP